MRNVDQKAVYGILLGTLVWLWTIPVNAEHIFYDHFGDHYGYSYGYNKDRDGYKLGYSQGYSYGYPGSHFGYSLNPYDADGKPIDKKNIRYGYSESDYRFSHGYPKSPGQYPVFETNEPIAPRAEYDPVFVSPRGPDLEP